jgi:hypothetical protein
LFIINVFDMKKIVFFLLLCLATLPALVSAQKWNSRPWDGIVALGTTNFMGDLGGGSGKAAHFLGVKDFDFTATRPVLQAGLRYKFHNRWGAKLDLSVGMLGGDDASSGNLGRQNRNLHFRSFFFENSLQLEFYIIPDHVAARYRYSSSQGWSNISVYMFTGVGSLLFNPQANYEGKWYSLRKLGTEGQGIGDNPPIYSNWAFVVPIGIGVKYSIDRFWSVGSEITFRYTSSDYIDDAGGKYFNVDEIANKYGAVAAALSDRNMDPYYYPVLDAQGNNIYSPYVSNARPYTESVPPRGNSNYNDAYMYLTFNLTYRFRYGILGAFSGKGRAKY